MSRPAGASCGSLSPRERVGVRGLGMSDPPGGVASRGFVPHALPQAPSRGEGDLGTPLRGGVIA